MATIDVIMPQMGESIAEGTISRWIKKVGDAVKRDEPIFEISTDKVDAEIPAPAAGVLAEILVQEGQTVAVQTVVARIETERRCGRGRRRRSPPPAPAPSCAGPAPAPRGARRSGSRAGRRRPAAAPRRRLPAAAGRAPAPAVAERRGRDRRGAAAAPVHAAGPQDGRRAQARI